ncbi:hypothetical protein H9P43_009716 [Blastocladiella emersonii ATCC 22665]|nr:hypothetical protein H9P43_009716 [Blastocladiella emersonii ATCC 22665]
MESTYTAHSLDYLALVHAPTNTLLGYAPHSHDRNRKLGNLGVAAAIASLGDTFGGLPAVPTAAAAVSLDRAPVDGADGRDGASPASGSSSSGSENNDDDGSSSGIAALSIDPSPTALPSTPTPAAAAPTSPTSPTPPWPAVSHTAFRTRRQLTLSVRAPDLPWTLLISLNSSFIVRRSTHGGSRTRPSTVEYRDLSEPAVAAWARAAYTRAALLLLAAPDGGVPAHLAAPGFRRRDDDEESVDPVPAVQRVCVDLAAAVPRTTPELSAWAVVAPHVVPVVLPAEPVSVADIVGSGDGEMVVVHTADPAGVLHATAGVGADAQWLAVQFALVQAAAAEGERQRGEEAARKAAAAEAAARSAATTSTASPSRIAGLLLRRQPSTTTLATSVNGASSSSGSASPSSGIVAWFQQGVSAISNAARRTPTPAPATPTPAREDAAPSPSPAATETDDDTMTASVAAASDVESADLPPAPEPSSDSTGPRFDQPATYPVRLPTTSGTAWWTYLPVSRTLAAVYLSATEPSPATIAQLADRLLASPLAGYTHPRASRSDTLTKAGYAVGSQSARWPAGVSEDVPRGVVERLVGSVEPRVSAETGGARVVVAYAQATAAAAGKKKKKVWVARERALGRGVVVVPGDATGAAGGEGRDNVSLSAVVETLMQQAP